MPSHFRGGVATHNDVAATAPYGNYPNDRIYCFEYLWPGTRYVKSDEEAPSGNAPPEVGQTESCLAYWDTGQYLHDFPSPVGCFIWENEDLVKSRAHLLRTYPGGDIFNTQFSPVSDDDRWKPRGILDRATVSPIIRCEGWGSALNFFYFLKSLRSEFDLQWYTYSSRGELIVTGEEGSTSVNIGITGRYAPNENLNEAGRNLRFENLWYPPIQAYEYEAHASKMFSHTVRMVEGVHVTWNEYSSQSWKQVDTYFTFHDPALTYYTQSHIWFNPAPWTFGRTITPEPVDYFSSCVTVCGIINIRDTDIFYILGSPYLFGMPNSAERKQVDSWYNPTLGWKTLESTYIEDGPTGTNTYPEDYFDPASGFGKRIFEVPVQTENSPDISNTEASVFVNVCWVQQTNTPELPALANIRIFASFEGYDKSFFN